MFRDERYISNPDEVTVPAHLNYGKYILDRIRRQKKENIALINGRTDEKITYGELSQYAVDLAVSLTELNTKVGDVVAICSESRNEFIPIVIGVLLTGAAYTPLDPKVGRADLKHKLNLVKPKHVICSKLFWDAYRDILKNYAFEKYIMIDDHRIESTLSINSLVSKNNNVQHFEPPNVKGQEDVALILYSSGSTGTPKGIMQTHLSCISRASYSNFDNPSHKTMICYGEWCHSYDNRMTFKFLTSGRTVIYFEGSVDVFLRSIEKHKANIAFTYPSLIYELTERTDLDQYNLDSLQVAYCGTSALDLNLKEKFITRFPKLRTFFTGYGMTETFELTSDRWGVPGRKRLSVGKPGLGIIIKIADINTKEPLGPNQRGELCVDVHNILKGYIGIEPSTYLDEEGFLRTGDLGYYDEDGYFYIVDRIKEIISYNGYKVSPLEIEALLLRHPGVKDAGVVGKAVPDYGEEPTAFIVRNTDYNVTEKELVDYIAYEAASHMQLRGGVKFVNEIPRSSIGKIRRPELKEMLNTWIIQSQKL